MRKLSFERCGLWAWRLGAAFSKMRRSSSATSLRTVSRKATSCTATYCDASLRDSTWKQGSKTYLRSDSFAAGFGDSAEAAAAEHGKQGPLRL